MRSFICVMLSVGVGVARAQELVPPPLPALAPTGPTSTGLTPPPGIVTSLPHPSESNPLPAVLEPVPPYPSTSARFGEPGGLFAATEIGILKPHVKNRVRVPIGPDTVELPQAELDTTGSGKFLLGYRFPDGYGAFAASYRTFTSSGFERFEEGSLLDQLNSRVRSQLDLNIVDVQYLSDRFRTWRGGGLSWEVGARVGSLYFDTEVGAPELFRVRTSNHFIGAGPQLAFALDQPVGESGLALFGKVDGAVLLGRITQRARATFGGPADEPIMVENSQSGSQAVPHVLLQAGVQWQPKYHPRLRFAAGYQWEQFWNAGSIQDSRGDIMAQGGFLRGEFRY